MTPAHEHFERRAQVYSKTASERPEFRERFGIFRDRIEKLAGADSSGNLALDLGCGGGHLTAVLAANGYSTVAFDGSSRMLELTQERILRDDLNGVVFRHQSLPFPVADVPYHHEVSLIVASSVIEYLNEDDLLLAQCAGMLAEGGHLLISFPNRRSIYWRVLAQLRNFGLLSHRDHSRQVHQYTLESARKLASRHGLKLDDHEYFSLPLQRYLPRRMTVRSPWVATMLLVDFRLVQSEHS